MLAAVQRYRLAEYLGAGPEAVNMFEAGHITNPVGYALVRAAVDWRRAGLARPVPERVLATPAMAAPYLADRPEVPRNEEALEQGIQWATKKINETVSLLGPVLTDPGEPAFEVFDYLVDHLTRAEPSIHKSIWQVSLREAQPTEWFDLALIAHQHGAQSVAEDAMRQAADTGNSDARYNLGVLLEQRGDWAEAETCRAAEAGHNDARYNLGVLLGRRDETGEADADHDRSVGLACVVPAGHLEKNPYVTTAQRGGGRWPGDATGGSGRRRLAARELRRRGRCRRTAHRHRRNGKRDETRARGANVDPSAAPEPT